MNWQRIILAAMLLLAPSTSSAQEGAKVFPNSVRMRFVRIPAGEFSMGRSQSYREILRLTTIHFGVDRAIRTEVPQHRVRIAAFLMQTTEVTQQQWKDVMGTRPWNNKGSFVKEGPGYPATYVTWNDAQEFCLRLGKMEGKTYRLPTEAEWEYACRAQTSTLYSFGDSPAEMPDYGWITDNAYSIGESFAHRVARQKPNEWGLYDMHGNVWEWCGDWFGEDYYQHSAEDDPRGPSDGTKRIIRGGSWRSSDTHARSTFRFGLSPSDAENDLGFRVVAVLSREPEIDELVREPPPAGSN